MYLKREGGGSKPKLEGLTENREHKLYVGNLDPRVTEYVLVYDDCVEVFSHCMSKHITLLKHTKHKNVRACNLYCFVYHQM